MSTFDDAMDRDANRVPLTGDYPFRTKRTIEFAGATTDAWGNDGGALDDSAIFTVTGLVQVKLIADIKTCNSSTFIDIVIFSFYFGISFP